MLRDVLECAVLCLVIVVNAKDAGQYFSNLPFCFFFFNLDFLIFCSILKRFFLQWKALDLLYKMRYIWVGRKL